MGQIKSYFLLLTLALCLVSCGGGSDDGDVNINPGGSTESPVKPDKMSLTVTLTEPGTLVEKIDVEKKYTTASLKVVGKINGTDILLLREMAGGDVNGKATKGMLAYLDLSDVQIVHGGRAYLTSQKTDILVTEDNTVPAGMFYGCVSLIKVYLPNSATTLEGRIFYNCTALENVYLPYSLKKIVDDPFYTNTTKTFKVDVADLRAWNDIDMSKRKANMSSDAVYTYRDKELTELTIPSGVTELSSAYMLIGPTTINVPSTVKKIGSGALSSSKLKKINLSEGIEEFDDYAFSGCEKLTSLKIPASVKNIGESCFRLCSVLKEISIPSSVEKLGSSAFEGCKSLTTLDLSSTKITEIGDHTFNGCINLTDLKLPNGLKKIDRWVFSEILYPKPAGLKSLTIPASVNYIEYNAFADCYITKLHMKSPTPPVVDTSLGFSSNYVEIYVPKGAKEAYNKKPWSSYDIIEE